MIALLSIPIGAVLILVLHLLKAQKKALLGVFFATLAFAFFSNVIEWAGGLQPYAIGGLFRVDNFTRFFAQIFIFVTGLGSVGLFSKSFVIPASEPESMNSGSLPVRQAGRIKSGMTSLVDVEIISVLLLLATFAMTLVAAATSVISLFLSMEFLAIAFYELVALKKDKIGMEAAIKFFVVGVASSLLFLLGAAFYYGALGTTNFVALTGAKFTPFLIASLILMLAGVGFKMSIFPLNLWLPDVYQGAPSNITAILAGAAKKAGFAAYARLFLPLLPLAGAIAAPASFFLARWQLLLAVAALLTMTFGNVAAVVQQNVKRLIAYSIIAHAGFIMIGFASANQLGYRGALLHIVIHAFMASGIFLMIGMLEEQGRHTLDEYGGIARQHPGFAALFVIFLASLTGVPPLAGFFSKFLLFSSAVEAGMLWLAVAAIVNSAISSYFYFVLLRRMFAYSPQQSLQPLQFPKTRVALCAVPAVFVVLLGLAPNALLNILAPLFT